MYIFCNNSRYKNEKIRRNPPDLSPFLEENHLKKNPLFKFLTTHLKRKRVKIQCVRHDKMRNSVQLYVFRKWLW